MCVCTKINTLLLRLVSVKLDTIEHGESGVVRFRLWQPTHDGQNQWAVDNLRVAPEQSLNTLQADMSVSSASQWSLLPIFSVMLFLFIIVL